MSQNNSSNQTKQNSRPKILLHNTNETLRDRQPQQKQAEIPPHVQEALRQRELSQSRIQEFYNARYNELHHVYSQKDKWAQKEIEKVRLELKQLAKKIDKFNQEVYKATLTPIVPGQSSKVYYKSFFEHVREIVEMLKTQVDQAGSWLNMYKRRCKGKGAYMQGMQKQGAQYMFSEERGLATSIG